MSKNDNMTENQIYLYPITIFSQFETRAFG